LHPAAGELTERRLLRIAEVASRRLSSITLVAESLWDSHNLAAVVRTCEALGLDEVHVVEQPNRYRRHPGILHGADRWIRIVRHPRLGGCLAGLREQGFLLCAADVGAGCVPLSDIPIDGPLAMILGTEKAGLTEAAREVADVRFSVPMSGFTGSLNVSVSAAIALYDLTGRRRRFLGTPGDLELEQAVKRAHSWIETSRRR
jgi:tRNA (guanosine-2'-O-)-methyltransferase